MNARVTKYVAMVCSVAALMLIALGILGASPDAKSIEIAICFAGFGLLSYALMYTAAGSNASGSTSFIPFVAAIVLAPAWTSVALIAVAVAVVEVMSRRARIKAVFNVAQIVVALGSSLLVFRATAEHAMLEPGSPFWSVPVALSSLAFFFVNGLAVSGAVAASEQTPFLEIWKKNTSSAMAFDILSLPVVFMFVWAYREHGLTGAALLSVPILGVRQLYKTNWQLQKNNQDLLELMVAAIEARDPYTSGHSRRVARNAKIIARAIGLTARQVDRVATAALLHDVGKIYEVFAPILRKPDRLTPEEWAIMQTHPIKSAELVMKVSILKDIVPSVRHHHENWDGTGYPDGIAGEAIPMGARIIMFADTIDAMMTDRPYRKALTESEVRSELVRCSGSQFDPELCRRLMGSPHFRHLFSPLGNPTPSYQGAFSLSKVG